MRFGQYIGLEHNHPTFNCWTLVLTVLREQFGLFPPEYDYKGDLKKADAIFIDSLSQWEEVDCPVRGAMVVFKLGGKPLHCGICVDQDHFLHCLEGRETCLERFDSPQWNKRIGGFYLWSQS